MVIGGEFALEIDQLKSYPINNTRTKGIFTFASGRGALYAVFIYLKEKLKIDRILLPEYLCSSIVNTVQQANLESAYVPLTSDFTLDKEYLSTCIKEHDAVLLINYFGGQHLDEIIHSLKKDFPLHPIIEDDVQAFFSFWENENEADFKITSLRKTFAIPEGGLLKTKYPLEDALGVNHFSKYKIAGGILKSLSYNDKAADKTFLALLQQGEDLIQNDINAQMSLFAKSLFERQNFQYVKVKRRANARYVISGLQDLKIKPLIPLDEISVPLFVPIYLENRDVIRKNLAKHNIFCPVHWPPDQTSTDFSKDLSAHELSIVIDQRYSFKEMDHILTLLKELL